MNSLGGVEKCIYLVWGIELGNYQYNNENDQRSDERNQHGEAVNTGQGQPTGFCAQPCHMVAHFELT